MVAYAPFWIFDFGFWIWNLTHNLQSKIQNELSFFRRFAGHHFFRRDLDSLLGCFLHDAEQAVMLGLARRATLGDFNQVALFGFVLLVVGVKHRAALEVLAVLLVAHLVVHDHFDGLVALIRRDHAFDRAEQ